MDIISEGKADSRIERDCMECEQTFITTLEENAEYCPVCNEARGLAGLTEDELDLLN